MRTDHGKTAGLQPADITGLFPDNQHHDAAPPAGAGRPLSLAWITDDLLRQTREVWSEAYGRSVSEDEAIEMLLNVKRLAEVMLNVTRKKGGVGDECGDLGACLVPGAEGGLLD